MAQTFEGARDGAQAGDAAGEQAGDLVLEVVAFAILMIGLGLGALFAPTIIAKRFGILWGDFLSTMRVVRAAGPALIATGAAIAVAGSGWARRRPRAVTLIVPALIVVGYVALTTCLADWMVDDAAITFAYSKNLATGHGLVITPGHAPEEGYSNTLWMLILAAAKVMGADIALTAKRTCVAFGALAAVLSYLVCDDLTGKRGRFAPLALALSIGLGAPFVIWSSSGLEHGLQAAAIMAVVAAPFSRFQRTVMVVALCALVLTRPEAPLIVAAVGLVLLLREPSAAGVVAAARRQWPVFVVPAVTLAALVVFRIAYFHDALSNPYYAKSHDANALRLVNFAGGSWAYVFGWLADARTWLVVPLILIAPWRKAPLPYQLAVAACAAQLSFVLYFGGDWMGCYRFLSPVLPALAVIVVYSLSEAGKKWSRLASNATCLALVWFLGLGTIGQLIAFRAQPTTPMMIVAEIGQTFVELGHRLGIEHPSLAHHDAGGTTYLAGIELVDLGGLADRAVAKHGSDPAFMRKYLFEDRRPTFVFGSSRTFAAGETRFFLMPEFSRYVRVKFPGRAYMEADLCHVRRDAIHEMVGVRHVENGADDYWVVD